VVTIEDNNILGGFGSAVLQLLNEQGLHLPMKILGYGDTFTEHGPQATLWKNAGIDADGIVRSVLELVSK
jgi:1-deoxy-D-xylulose-5-phosphate synthase